VNAIRRDARSGTIDTRRLTVKRTATALLVALLILIAGAQASAQAAPKGYVYVKGGTFQMGDLLGAGFGNEKPIHQVQVSSFLISATEVTQKEWRDVMGTDPSRFKGDDLPVQDVSWEEAVEYCNRKSVKEKLTPCYSGSGDAIKCNFLANGYRLPTEAEWEFAAKGGLASKGSKYIGGDDPDAVGWFKGNAGNTAHPVGTKKPNELGLYDMGGNVAEWCWDLYSDYASAPQADPRGPAANGETRVFRGGSWLLEATNMRATRRDYAQGPGFMRGLRGLRPVRTYR
jgi:formylglycine-generating enzyme